MLELIPKLNKSSKTPLYIQIYKYIKDEILCGNIQAESKLPSIRSLANNLKLSKNTIEAAYEQLIAEGYATSKYRSGLFVEKLDMDFSELKTIATNTAINFSDKSSEDIVKYDFSSGQMDLDSFPYHEFKKILGRCIDENNKELLLYGEHKGDYGLRVEIAKHIHYSRGVICSPEQIIVSSGTQQALTLLCHLLSNFELTVAFEEPGYLGAKAVFQHFKFNVLPIELEQDGINVEAIKNCSAKIVYVTPSHQYPLGMVMPISKRIKLLNWAEKNQGIIIEDDYDGEFRFKGKPIPSLQGMDENGKVVYIGSFSKSLMPSMRISYLVLPMELLKIYDKEYKIYEQPVSRLAQKSLEIFIKEGHFEKHLRKARLLYKKKQEILLTAINEEFKESAELIGADSGLHILLKLNTKLSEHELIHKARMAGVKLNPISIHWLKPIKNDFPLIFIGFAGIKAEHIEAGIKILKKCWFL